MPQEGDSPGAWLLGWRGPKEEAALLRPPLPSEAQHPWVLAWDPQGITGVWTCLCRPHPLQQDGGLAISQAASWLPHLTAQHPFRLSATCSLGPAGPWAPSPARELGVSWAGAPRSWHVCLCAASRASASREACLSLGRAECPSAEPWLPGGAPLSPAVTWPPWGINKVFKATVHVCALGKGGGGGGWGGFSQGWPLAQLPPNFEQSLVGTLQQAGPPGSHSPFRGATQPPGLSLRAPPLLPQAVSSAQDRPVPSTTGCVSGRQGLSVAVTWWHGAANVPMWPRSKHMAKRPHNPGPGSVSPG